MNEPIKVKHHGKSSLKVSGKLPTLGTRIKIYSNGLKVGTNSKSTIIADNTNYGQSEALASYIPAPAPLRAIVVGY